MHRIIPDEDQELMHIQHMHVNGEANGNDNDNDDNDSDNGSNETESDVETYISDEQMPPSSDDQFPHVYDNSSQWDENIDPNEFLRQLIHGDACNNIENEYDNRNENMISSRIGQSSQAIGQAMNRSITDGESGIDDDTNWTTSSDVNFLL
ncbi:hypothetical protein LOAG_06117 [Loa loa]|uniref:Uncharacterized protein n=1 Tax=Loa loa TaxID=7209 RepID=A0A1S0TYB8_LOALO|nr:hypothetical protein LOAG_06117 [Loa loa]EFO22373.1 hypothetical protein LOAG_06117 [Loa loa]